MEVLELSVDSAKCEGHGICEHILPEVFRVDDDEMKTHIVGPELVESRSRVDLEACVSECPTGALRLTQSVGSAG